MSPRFSTASLAVMMILTASAAPRPSRASEAPHTHDHAAASAAKSPHAHDPKPAAATLAPLFNDLGSTHRAITTRSPQAQRYFDQGLRLMWAFNLEEAQRSFEQAAKLDPACASCQWGVAMSLGPHINLPALPDRTVAANAAARRALALARGASPVERDLIEALVKRYSDPAPTDPKLQFAMDSTYAEAMREVARRHPDDDDVVALSVEAQMDLHPWDYWTQDGKPRPWTPEIVETLEKILTRDPKHPGVNHYYIHAVEASRQPEKALHSADVLVDAMPGAGHLVHMPSHVYERVGRYDDSYAANARAVESDRRYFGKAGPQGFYHMYAAHNHHFLAWTAMKQGRSAAALKHAHDATAMIPPEMMAQMPGMDLFATATPCVLVRFGRWDEILSEPMPSPGFPYLNGIWHYARGLALAAKGRLPEAAAERDSVAAIAAAVPADLMEDLNSARSLLAVAHGELSGVLAVRSDDLDAAIGLLERAARDQDALRYSEPEDWFTSVRLTLGGTLLRAGRADRAEAVFREDLERRPEFGWSLYGLAKSLEAQRKNTEAADLQKRFEKAWSGADFTLSAAGL